MQTLLGHAHGQREQVWFLPKEQGLLATPAASFPVPIAQAPASSHCTPSVEQAISEFPLFGAVLARHEQIHEQTHFCSMGLGKHMRSFCGDKHNTQHDEIEVCHIQTRGG